MIRRNLLLSASALLFAAQQQASAKTAGGNATAQFGMSASLTGGQAAYGQDMQAGILAAFAEEARKSGGVQHALVTLDDGGNREKCQANVAELIGSGAVALVGLTSGAAAEACMPAIEAAQIVLLGTASGNMGIRKNTLLMPFHVRSGYDNEYRRMVAYVKEFGMQRVGYVHLKDTSPANQQAMTSALDAVGIKLTLTLPVDRNSKDFAAEARTLLAAKVDCVLFTTNAKPIEQIIATMSAEKYGGTYFSSSFAGQSLITALAGSGHTIIMSQVVPRPNATQYRVVKDFHEAMASVNAVEKIGYTSLEGYITGRVAAEAARVAASGGAVRRDNFRVALSGLNLDLGGYRVRFAGGSQTGSSMIDIVALDRYGRIIG